jgi:hypothetical protein
MDNSWSRRTSQNAGQIKKPKKPLKTIKTKKPNFFFKPLVFTSPGHDTAIRDFAEMNTLSFSPK